MSIDINGPTLYAVYALSAALAWSATMHTVRVTAEHGHKRASWHAWRRVCEQMLQRWGTGTAKHWAELLPPPPAQPPPEPKK